MEVSFEKVNFGYRKEHRVLNDINLKIQGPGLVCVIGPNGVGKSTLVKCINRIVQPSSGKVKIDGRDVSEMTNKEIAKEVGYVPATSNDCFSLPVIDAILIGRHNHQGWGTSKKDLAFVYRAMEMLDIKDLAMSGYNELSAGQHQKVSLARGLVQDTNIIVLDEPTANLDVKHQVYVTQLLRALADQEKKLIIMICHDLNIAARYASEIVVMGPPGVIHSRGSPEDVMKEDTIREIYGIDCEVISYENRPMIILKSTFA